jgi:WD40 repeat protein
MIKLRMIWHQLTGGGTASPPVRLWRVSDGALVQALPHPGDVMYVSFSPDGDQLVTGGEDGATRLWRLRAIPN